MKASWVIGLVFIVQLCGCSSDRHLNTSAQQRMAFKVTFEVRHRQAPEINANNIEAELITLGSSSRGPLKQRAEKNFFIFQGDDLLQSDFSSCTIIVNNQTDVLRDIVFSLGLPSTPKPLSWTEWKRPDFINPKGHTAWHLLNGGKALSETPPPADTWEMRYKLEKWNSDKLEVETPAGRE